MLCLDDNQDSFRELGGNDILEECMKENERTPQIHRGVILNALAKVMQGNGKHQKVCFTKLSHTENNMNFYDPDDTLEFVLKVLRTFEDNEEICLSGCVIFASLFNDTYLEDKSFSFCPIILKYKRNKEICENGLTCLLNYEIEKLDDHDTSDSDDDNGSNAFTDYILKILHMAYDIMAYWKENASIAQKCLAVICACIKFDGEINYDSPPPIILAELKERIEEDPCDEQVKEGILNYIGKCLTLSFLIRYNTL